MAGQASPITGNCYLYHLLSRRLKMSAESAFCSGPTPANNGGAEAAITLSVIIASFNTREILSDCLRSIYQNPPSCPYEIIVVDDASTDGTSGMVRDRFPEVRLLQNEINRDYAYSNNRALQQARGQYLCLLNSDTIILPHAFDRMLAFLEMHPEAGIVGCRLISEDGSIQWTVKSLPNAGSALFGARSAISRIFPNNRFSRTHLLQMGRDTTTPLLVESGYVSGAAAMMPRKVVDEAGYLDAELFYHVDADHCKRIAEAGYKCYYLPTAAIVHLEHKGGTMASLPKRFRSLLRFEVHSYIYYRKHFLRSAWSPMQILVPVGLLLHFIFLAAGQTSVELARAMRTMLQPKKAAR
jgi:N-acetylglucosaminyl-diphospho-decaprenol L-rhamnosyltransferase